MQAVNLTAVKNSFGDMLVDDKQLQSVSIYNL